MPQISTSRPALRTPRAGEPLDRVLDRLGTDAIAVVVDEDVPIGLVTTEQLASYVALHPRA
jgi:hypothetical protein